MKLGSLNDTEAWDEEETIHRGEEIIEIHESKPKYFKIPVESYLIPGPKLGFEEDVCYLSITGAIPDEINSAVLGQPFLENYFTVLDQENMKIGLGAHKGSDAEISDVKFGDLDFSIMLALILMCCMLVIFAYMSCKCIAKKVCPREMKESYANNDIGDDLVRTNS